MIALTMNQAIGVVVRIVGNTNGLTHLQSRRKARMPEFIVNLHIRERQDTHSNRALLEMTNRDKIARIGNHTHDFTFFYTLVHALDSTREHPWMKTPKTLILTFTQLNLLVHPLLF